MANLRYPPCYGGCYNNLMHFLKEYGSIVNAKQKGNSTLQKRNLLFKFYYIQREHRPVRKYFKIPKKVDRILFSKYSSPFDEKKKIVNPVNGEDILTPNLI